MTYDRSEPCGMTKGEFEDFCKEIAAEVGAAGRNCYTQGFLDASNGQADPDYINAQFEKSEIWAGYKQNVTKAGLDS